MTLTTPGLNEDQICCNILHTLIERHGFIPHLYADDTQILGSCRPSASQDHYNRSYLLTYLLTLSCRDTK